MSRTIAIGDIHGCSRAFDGLLSQISPQQDDTIVTLGDYVDRGIDSKGVLDRLIELSNICQLIPILGNHDEMMLKSRTSDAAHDAWMSMHGDTTLESYHDTDGVNLVLRRHFRFLESCRPYYETETHIFLHANYKPDLSLDLLSRLDPNTIRWLSLRNYVPPKPHCSGKIVVVGHTPQKEVLDLGYLICLDTGCAMGGELTAMDVHSRQIWAATE